jgi:hypothetical protein
MDRFETSRRGSRPTPPARPGRRFPAVHSYWGVARAVEEKRFERVAALVLLVLLLTTSLALA